MPSSKWGLVKKEIVRGKENIFKLSQGKEHHLLACFHYGHLVLLLRYPSHEIAEAIEKSMGCHTIDSKPEIYGVAQNVSVFLRDDFFGRSPINPCKNAVKYTYVSTKAARIFRH